MSGHDVLTLIAVAISAVVVCAGVFWMAEHEE